jgi:WD40 repeat protein
MDSGFDSARVFISYSHKDQKYLEELHSHLAYYEQTGSIAFWDDTRILPGSLWYREIEKAIASAKVAILLVSADYLASEFIAKNELTPLLVAANKKGVKIVPVILRPCAFEHTPLAQFQAINSPSKPLSSMSKGQRETVWEKVAETIETSLAATLLPPQTSGESVSSQAPLSSPTPTEPPAITQLYTYRGHIDRVSAVQWSPDGKFIASASDDGTMQIWDATTGRRVTAYRGVTHLVLTLAWSPDGKYIAVGGDNTNVVVVDLMGKIHFAYSSEAQVVAALAWSPDGKYLSSASANIWPFHSDEDIVEVINIFTKNRVFTHRSHARARAALSWSPNGKYLASADYNGTIEILDITGTPLPTTYHGSSDQVNAVMWSPDGSYIAAAQVDGTVQVWDTHTKNVISQYRGYSGAIHSIAWSSDGKYIASAGEGQTVQIWEAATGKTVQTYYGHSGTVFSVAWSPYGQRIASAGQDKTVQVWQVNITPPQESKEQWLQQGNSYSQAKRYEEALAAYEQAIRLDPNFARSYLNMGNALYNLGRYKEALQAYEQAIRLDPNFARSYHNLGDVLSQSGQYEEAYSSYKKALQLEQATGDTLAEQHEYSSLSNIRTNVGRIQEEKSRYPDRQDEYIAGNEGE